MLLFKKKLEQYVLGGTTPKKRRWEPEKETEEDPERERRTFTFFNHLIVFSICLSLFLEREKDAILEDIRAHIHAGKPVDPALLKELGIFDLGENASKSTNAEKKRSKEVTDETLRGSFFLRMPHDVD